MDPKGLIEGTIWAPGAMGPNYVFQGVQGGAILNLYMANKRESVIYKNMYQEVFYSARACKQQAVAIWPFNAINRASKYALRNLHNMQRRSYTFQLCVEPWAMDCCLCCVLAFECIRTHA